jgi:hypothetical protein
MIFLAGKGIASPSAQRSRRGMLSNKSATDVACFIISTSLPLINHGRFVKIIKAAFAAFYLSGKRDSNPRPSAWEADALPLSYSRKLSATKIMNRFVSAKKLI